MTINTVSSILSVLCLLILDKNNAIYISETHLKNLTQTVNYNTEQLRCPKGFNGTIPDYTDCFKYINCTNNFPQSCPEGKLYDVTQNICENPDIAVCVNSKNGKETHRIKRSLYTNFKCKSSFGIEKHPFDCKLFLHCNHGHAIVKSCGPGTVFNPSLSACDYPYNVNCDKDENEEMHVAESFYTGYRGRSVVNRVHTCGYRYLRNKVAGGSVAKRREYPWQVAIRVITADQYVHHCGAVIITSKFLLSAAHCFKEYTKDNLIVYAGDYKETKIEGTEQNNYIKDIFIHPNYNSLYRRYDIAVLELEREFYFNEHIQPICLPEENEDYEKDLICTFSGFGASRSDEESSPVLKYGRVPLISRSDCTKKYIYGDLIYDDMFCAGYFDGRVDTCAGDSGGPLACEIDGVFTLYGITSWGAKCGMVNKPGVYAKVAYFRKWIDRTIKNV